MSNRYHVIITSILATTTVIIVLALIGVLALNIWTDPEAIPSFETPVSVLEACVGILA